MLRKHWCSPWRAGATAEDAARQCGLDVNAVRRKLADAKFRRRVVAARAALTERTCGLLTAAGLAAAEALVELARGDGPPAVRLAAAKAVLDAGLKLREVVDLEARVDDLERQLDERDAVEQPKWQ
jgi:hypothetical protein